MPYEGANAYLFCRFWQLRRFPGNPNIPALRQKHVKWLRGSRRHIYLFARTDTQGTIRTFV